MRTRLLLPVCCLLAAIVTGACAPAPQPSAGTASPEASAGASAPGASPTASAPTAVTPAPGQLAVTATAGVPSQLACGSSLTFPMAALAATPGAESAEGAPFDALRTAIAGLESTDPATHGITWSVASRSDTRLVAIARITGPTPDWVAIELRPAAGGAWQAEDPVRCRPVFVITPTVHPATWTLDPASATPAADTTTVAVLLAAGPCQDDPAAGGLRALASNLPNGGYGLLLGVGDPATPTACLPAPSPAPSAALGIRVLVTLPAALGDRQLVDLGTPGLAEQLVDPNP